MKLEFVESLALAHPFIKGFEQISYCMNDEEVRSVAQGEISEAVAKRKKEDIDGHEGASAVYSTTFYIGLAVEPKQRAFQSSTVPGARYVAHIRQHQAGSVGPRRLDISYPTTEFSKLVKMWEKFDELKMGIVVRNIKRSSSVFPSPHLRLCIIYASYLFSSSLPDYVFDEGERQPRQALKRPKKEVRSNSSADSELVFTYLLRSRPTIGQITRHLRCRIRNHGWLKEQSPLLRSIAN